VRWRLVGGNQLAFQCGQKISEISRGGGSIAASTGCGSWTRSGNLSTRGQRQAAPPSQENVDGGVVERSSRASRLRQVSDRGLGASWMF